MTDFLYKVIIGISIQIDGRVRLSSGWTSLRRAREVSLLTALEQTREDAVKSVTNAPDTLSSMRQYSLSVLAIASSRGKNQSKVSQK